MERAHNFAAGPAALPTAVLLQAQEELLNFRGLGASVMEISHRSAEFIAVAETAEADLRDLLGITDDYAVLFLSGGATTQWASVPFNLAQAGDTVDYVDTGAWSKKAIAEGRRFANVNVVASSAASNYNHIPAQSAWKCSMEARYLHICGNETIGGVQFHKAPVTNPDVPLVADMSSELLSRPMDVSKYGVIYAGAQKNLGPAGITIVIVRRDLIGNARPGTPSMLDYKTHADSGSMSNTPPTYSWYLAGLVFKWLKNLGGLKAVAAINQAKADALYRVIDNSNYYTSPVPVENRSLMNVPFTLPSPDLDAVFLKGAVKHNLLNLKGHRSVGGMRASIYNAVTQESVAALVEYMTEFQRNHG